MQEHGETRPKYTLKRHKGPTQRYKQQMEQSPIKIFDKISPNFEKQPKDSKIPNHQNPKQKYCRI